MSVRALIVSPRIGLNPVRIKRVNAHREVLFVCDLFELRQPLIVDVERINILPREGAGVRISCAGENICFRVTLCYVGTCSVAGRFLSAKTL